MSDEPLFHVGQEGVTTRDGRKVRILCVDRKLSTSIVALIDEEESLLVQAYPNGRVSRNREHNDDLIPPPPPKQYAWVLAGKTLDGKLHAMGLLRDHPVSKEETKVGAVGCIRVELAERWDE